MIVFGFALNEFIDQADTSTLNYLKYYESIGRTISTFDGLHTDDPANFPNSFLYNCDMLLFEYFIGLITQQGTPKYPYQNPSDPVDQTLQQPIPRWSTDNCERRHLYNLNCFWQKLLTTIDNDHNYVNGGYNFILNAKTDAIECLRKIVFTGFEMIKRTTNPTTYVDFLYKYPKWKIDDGNGEEYYYVTTQSLCASNIPTVSANVKPRPEGKTTKEQKSCFKGLKILTNSLD